jgi:hypothetical protein
MSIEYTWQGAGFARFGFYFNNQFIVCHEEIFSNVLTTVSITTPCLPVRFEITNIGTAVSSTTFRCICISVSSEGGYTPRGIGYSISNTSSVTIGNNNSVALLAIRLKTLNNRIPVIIKNISLLSITGGSWVSSGTFSAVEYNQTMTSFSPGELIKSGFISAQSRQQNSPIESTFKLVSDLAGVSGTFLIVGSAQGGLGNGGARAAIDWLEEW